MKFENRVLRRTSGPKRYEIRRGWRKLHNELEFLAKENNQSRRMGWTGYVERMGKLRLGKVKLPLCLTN
jgi:hypothetical protein